VSWLYVAGGITTLLYALWLFVEFTIGAALDWLLRRIKHD
jgi:hypothetical protein